MICHRCAFAGLDVCVCGAVVEDLRPPAPQHDPDPEAELYVPQSAREAS